MAQGYAFDPNQLSDTVYNGISLGLPRWLVKLTWRKFMKAFHFDVQTEHLRGWNIRTIDDELTLPWTPRLKGGRPHTFGHFDVSTCTSGVHTGRICLDYSRGGLGGNGLLNGLRDPLVALHPDSAEYLLGMSYVRLGAMDIRTPSYFLLHRQGPLSEPVMAP